MHNEVITQCLWFFIQKTKYLWIKSKSARHSSRFQGLALNKIDKIIFPHGAYILRREMYPKNKQVYININIKYECIYIYNHMLISDMKRDKAVTKE